MSVTFELNKEVVLTLKLEEFQNAVKAIQLRFPDTSSVHTLLYCVQETVLSNKRFNLLHIECDLLRVAVSETLADIIPRASASEPNLELCSTLSKLSAMIDTDKTKVLSILKSRYNYETFIQSRR